METDILKRKADDLLYLDEDTSSPNKYLKKDDSITVKFLMPDVVVGGMLRKDSPVFKHIKKSVSYGPNPARILLSDKGIYFPGTLERIVVLSGPPYLVYQACCMFQDQIIDDLHLSTDSTGENKSGPRQGQMKFVVGSRAASIVIGKKGVHINDVSKYFNVDIDVYVPSHPDLRDERVITVIGPSINVFDALEPILYQISQQSDHINEEYKYYKEIEEPLENKECRPPRNNGRWSWQVGGKKNKTQWVWLQDAD